MTWMGESAHNHGGPATATNGTPTMSGMASDAELAKLKSLSGKESAAYFLQLMLRHHQGGLAMTKYALEHAATSPVRNLADKIISLQTHENNVMTTMLAERGALSLPPPN